MDERTVTLPIAEGQDLASISTQVRRFAEQLGITETPLTQLLSTTDECARKLLRWKKETASLILRARPSETILHWQAQNLRIAMDPNRAALSQTIAPVSRTLAPGSTTLAPGSATAATGDLRVNALGTRWLFERMPKITQLERRTPPPPHIYRQVTARFRFGLGGCYAYRDIGTRAKESEVASGAGVGVVE